MNVDLTIDEIDALLSAKNYCIAAYKDNDGYLRPNVPYYINDLQSAVNKLIEAGGTA